MDKVRKSGFSGSWYPGDREEVLLQLEKWESVLGPADREIISGIVPHAGWYFSGKLAYDVIRRLRRDTDVIVVLGGHLAAGSPGLYWTADMLETPCGNLPVHRELLNYIISETGAIPGDGPDNTIEVQLPMIRSVLGEIPVIALRIPPDRTCLKTAAALKQYCDVRGQSAVVLGSTDLTHYGMNYGFAPEGSEEDPLSWVARSDGKILRAMEIIDTDSILELGERTGAACSAGAAACAACFASLLGIEKGEILAYDTSYSKHEAESFVGYGTVIYGS